MASTSANERAENTKHLKNRRGETVGELRVLEASLCEAAPVPVKVSGDLGMSGDAMLPPNGITDPAQRQPLHGPPAWLQPLPALPANRDSAVPPLRLRLTLHTSLPWPPPLPLRALSVCVFSMQDKSGWAGCAAAAGSCPALLLPAPAAAAAGSCRRRCRLLPRPAAAGSCRRRCRCRCPTCSCAAAAYLMSVLSIPPACCARWGNLINTMVLVILMAAAGQYNKPYKCVVWECPARALHELVGGRSSVLQPFATV